MSHPSVIAGSYWELFHCCNNQFLPLRIDEIVVKSLVSISFLCAKRSPHAKVFVQPRLPNLKKGHLT